MHTQESTPVFTICVPTYNRGQKALNVAYTLMDQIDDDWELLFLDNFSWQETDSYHALEQLAANDHRISYVRHTHNPGFHTNYLACFELAAAPYIMIVSDEDFANPDMIRSVLPLLHQYPSVGIMRGSIVPVEGVKPKNSEQWEDESFFKGEEAFFGFGFINNYFSGTIYNRQLFQELGLIERLKTGLTRNTTYPHLYLELLACAVTDVVVTAEICCFEGEDQVVATNNPNDYRAPYSFGSRVDQFIILRDGLWEAVTLMGEPFNQAVFAGVYLWLCEKYMYLISRVNSTMYLANKIHPGLLLKAFMHICCAGIMKYPEMDSLRNELGQEIQKLHDKYQPYD